MTGHPQRIPSLALDANTMTVERKTFGTLADGRPLSGGGQGINLFRRAEERWRLTFEQLTPDTRTAKA
jgi:hypothetical protein